MKTKQIVSLRIFIIIAIAASVINTDVYSAGQHSLNQGQIDLIEKLQQQGLLEMEPKLNKVMIDPALWASMKYTMKEDVAATFAIYCANQKGTQTYWVEIYDLYSGRKLAKYSQAWGFSVED